mmetsp:Transcript_18129/g.47881  ORF Transcript_18129/g.47881 Transcript_18129/m.47881 type:complete len:270 (+) Transcript_18129:1131-1940(+)
MAVLAELGEALPVHDRLPPAVRPECILDRADLSSRRERLRPWLGAQRLARRRGGRGQRRRLRSGAVGALAARGALRVGRGRRHCHRSACVDVLEGGALPWQPFAFLNAVVALVTPSVPGHAWGLALPFCAGVGATLRLGAGVGAPVVVEAHRASTLRAVEHGPAGAADQPANLVDVHVSALGEEEQGLFEMLQAYAPLPLWHDLREDDVDVCTSQVAILAQLRKALPVHVWPRPTEGVEGTLHSAPAIRGHLLNRRLLRALAALSGWDS